MAPRKPKRRTHIGGMSTKDFTPDQMLALAEVEVATASGARLFQLLYGGVRAGKSTCGAFGIAIHSIGRVGCEYIVGAYTQRQAMAIFMPKFKMAAELLDIHYKASKSLSNPHIEFGANIISLFGGSDVGRDRNVQGLTIAGLLLDEIPLLNREFVHQNEARASEDGALRIYTANKVHPYHWTTKYYFNRAKAGTIKASLYDSDTSDNQHISQDYIDERINEYDDLHRTRFIDNEFALDASPLYEPQFDDAVGDDLISVIYGSGNTMYVLTAARAEYGICITEAVEYAASTPITELVLGATVLVNADRPMLAKALRRSGNVVRGYMGEYIPRRLEQSQRALAGGEMRISPGLDTLTEAIDEYNTGGMYRSDYIRCMEALGEYITRRKVTK